MISPGGFGKTAQGLARNPLGIIALFIVLVYGFACLVVGASANLTADDRHPIIWFMVGFPVVVLGVFTWLVAKHHGKLYGPGDYKREENFLASLNPALRSLEAIDSPGADAAAAVLQAGSDVPAVAGEDGQKADAGWEAKRVENYRRQRGVFIGHVLEPSTSLNQEFDIFIYLIRHQGGGFDDVIKAEFFFGHHWGNKVYEAQTIDGLIGVKTSAYGPFAALCKVTFRDGSSVMLNKYIDFEMGYAVKKLLSR